MSILMASMLKTPPLKMRSKRGSSTAQADAFAGTNAKEKIGPLRSE